MLDKVLRTVEKLIPKNIYKFFQPLYHMILGIMGTFIYRFPSRHIHVIAVTGTKGKSSTLELMNAILEEAGYKTSILSTIRFKIGEENKKNLFKMTMPGRFFVQKFLRESVDAKCDYALIEMTSEGAKFWRHIGVEMDSLIFTNLTPEHIESHGGFENYKKCKLRLAHALSRSSKKVKTIVANLSDDHGKDFLNFNVDKKLSYTKDDIDEIELSVDGDFNKLNALACKTLALSFGIKEEIINSGLLKLKEIPGRVQHVSLDQNITTKHKQNFEIIIDYAHTEDSLRKLYETYRDLNIIAVLGSTGGGRDKWKRPLLGKVADEYSRALIITDEDPYDDDPMSIMTDVQSGVSRKILDRDLFVEIDRRKAISHAISIANITPNSIVLVTGKGTDPYIMRKNGEKEKWSDYEVAKEELIKILNK